MWLGSKKSHVNDTKVGDNYNREKNLGDNYNREKNMLQLPRCYYTY